VRCKLEELKFPVVIWACRPRWLHVRRPASSACLCPFQTSLQRVERKNFLVERKSANVSSAAFHCSPSVVVLCHVNNTRECEANDTTMCTQRSRQKLRFFAAVSKQSKGVAMKIFNEFFWRPESHQFKADLSRDHSDHNSSRLFK